MKRICVAAGISALALMTMGVSIPQAHAAEAWSKDVTCAQGARCTISTDTTGAVRHVIGGVRVNAWRTGGFHTSSRDWMSRGTVRVYANTDGDFTYQIGTCSYPHPRIWS